MNLQTTIAGVTFRNPIITASGTYGFGREYSTFYSASELGGVVSKGLTLAKRQGNPGTRIAETASGILNSVGLQNPGLEDFLAHELDYFVGLDTVKIVNVAGFSKQEYVTMVAELSRTAVDMIELNISCPNVKAGGMAFGIDPASVLEITRAVRAVCSKPLIVKLSPNVAAIAQNALAAQNGGADAISLINTLGGMAVDIASRKPVLGVVTGGLSGACIKPVALKMVYECFKNIKIPIIGMGGIMSADDVVEFLLVGASAVMVGTASLCDPLAPKTIANELTHALKKCKMNSVAEIIGGLIV